MTTRLTRRRAGWIRTGLAALSAALGAASATAEVQLFSSEAFSGLRIALVQPSPDLALQRFSGRTASLVVGSGDWQLCSLPQFRGTCVVFGPGQYDRLPGALAAQVASARPVSVTPGGTSEPPPRPQPPFGATGLTLYQDRGFAGRTLDVTEAVGNLDSTGFNDEASSMVVSRGRWQLCQHADFGPPCEVFGPGRYELSGSLHDGVSSVRRVFGTGDVPLPAGGGVALFENADFDGRSFITGREVRNLRDVGFNDTVSSIEVQGGRWELCAAADYGGPCQTYGAGSHVLSAPLRDRLSSLRPR